MTDVLAVIRSTPNSTCLSDSFCFQSQPVLSNWFTKGHGIFIHVKDAFCMVSIEYNTMTVKYPLLYFYHHFGQVCDAYFAKYDVSKK